MNERRESAKRKIMILGGGPNRIGQGIEFDYCCVHAAFALRDIDLTKIESRPIEGRPWEYSFYVDIGGDTAEPNIMRAIDHLREMCEVVRTAPKKASKRVDVRHFCTALTHEPGALEMELAVTDAGTARPEELTQAVAALVGATRPF